MSIAEKSAAFRALHQSGKPFILPNPWDAGSARILEGLGFAALATTSSGFALTKGRDDYGVTREEVITHCREIASAVDIPVTADLENGFGAAPEDAATTIEQAVETGLCGGSIEDSTGNDDDPIFELSLAVERVSAAVEAAKKSGAGFVLTARAEAFLHGQGDLDRVIERLQAYEKAGADVLYAPGLPDLDAVRAVCGSVSKPVNVLIMGKLAKLNASELADAGAARLSIGGGLAWPAYGSLANATSMLTEGSFDALFANKEGARKIDQWLK